MRFTHRYGPARCQVPAYLCTTPEAGLEHDLRPTGGFLRGSDPRIAETGPHVKGKCTAAEAAALDMRSVFCLFCW